MDISQIILRITITFPVFLIALVLHEYAHAWMAKRFGDSTSEWQGRLTLNPAPHIDPIGTIAMPLAGMVFGGFLIGWAKPVPIDPRNFSSYRRGLFWVAFAGPAMNLILGFISAFLLVIFIMVVPKTFFLFDPFAAMLNTLVLINFMLAIFNLLPIPPLDGSNMIMSQLSGENARRFEAIQPYGLYILLFFLFSGAIQIIITPIYFLKNLSINIATMVLGFS